MGEAKSSQEACSYVEVVLACWYGLCFFFLFFLSIRRPLTVMMYNSPTVNSFDSFSVSEEALY